MLDAMTMDYPSNPKNDLAFMSHSMTGTWTQGACLQHYARVLLQSPEAQLWMILALALINPLPALQRQ